MWVANWSVIAYNKVKMVAKYQRIWINHQKVSFVTYRGIVYLHKCVKTV